jgi:hypothetical protein
MKRESDYKGHRIECRLIGKWFAQVFPPGSQKALPMTPVATREEGYDYLLQIVHRLIDAREEEVGPTSVA